MERLESDLAELRRENESLKQELTEYQTVFEMTWKADMRAIDMWHEKGGDKLKWPDHAEMVVWLLEQLTEARAIAAGVVSGPRCDGAIS